MSYAVLQALADDETALRARLAERLDSLGTHEASPSEVYKPAAVLTPIVMLEARPHLLFLRRPKTMREHSGQIAFPGGRLDPGETVAQAALREAEEELGIDTRLPGVLGCVPGIPTVTNYWVSPVVAWLDQPPPITPNPAEVDEYFYASLAELLNPTIYEGHPVTWKGRDGFIDYFHYPHPDGTVRIIWGATGRMLHQFFVQVFDWEPPV